MIVDDPGLLDDRKRMTSSSRDDDPLAPSFAEQFSDWYLRVRRWLAAWTEVNQLWTGSSWDFNFVAGNENGFALRRMTFEHVGTHYIDPLLPSRRQLEAAFLLSSRGTEVPLAHSLILDAEVAYSAGDYGGAIVSSCTAIEVSLAEAIRKRLDARIVPDVFVSEVERQANGLVGLYRLCRALGIDLCISQSQLQNSIADIRNRYSHAGKRPDHYQVREALKHSRTVIRAATPMPAPGDLTSGLH